MRCSGAGTLRHLLDELTERPGRLDGGWPAASLERLREDLLTVRGVGPETAEAQRLHALLVEEGSRSLPHPRLKA